MKNFSEAGPRTNSRMKELFDKRSSKTGRFIECPTANKEYPISKAGGAIVVPLTITVDLLTSSLDIPCWLLDIQFQLHTAA